MKRSAGRVAAMLALVAATGCAQPPQSPPAEAAENAPIRAERCFRVADIDSWRVIDERQLIVYAPGRKDAWHVRLFSACYGLRFTEVLGFRAKGTNWICGDPGDDIVWRENRCAIASVRPVSPAEVKMLLDPAVREDIGKMPPASLGGKEPAGDEERK